MDCSKIKEQIESLQTEQSFFAHIFRAWVKDQSKINNPTPAQINEQVSNIRSSVKRFLEMKKEVVQLFNELDPTKEAREIMGQDYYGPDEIFNTHGIKIKLNEIPHIPFTKTDLIRAKELNQQLVLFIDKASDGQPLTMKQINDDLQLRYTKENEGKLLFDVDWYKDEPFYITQTPRVGWKLMTKEVLPNSLNKNFLEQTQELVNYLQNEVYKNQSIPQECQEAIDEFNQKKKSIEGIISSNWEEAAKQLSSLKINKDNRRTPIETLYTLPLVYDKTKLRQLEKVQDWTPRLASVGLLVSLGPFDSSGLRVSSDGSGDRISDLGVVFFRSH